MYKYFQNLVFYSLAFLESLLNFLCALVGFYPAIDWAINFMVGCQMSKVGKEISERSLGKNQELSKANGLIDEANSLDHG